MGDENVDEIVKNFISEQNDIIIDRYSDSGAFGELYFGTRKLLNDRVALKFYSYNEDLNTHNEPILLKSIKHRNILEIYDARIIDKQFAYFLTPEISGGDLKYYIDHNVITLFDAINFTQQILSGLNELHQSPNNLLHRDLKPNNILIDKGSKNIYISDFGSIKYIDDKTESVVASKSTEIYKSYEVITDNKYTRKADIYQIGLIFFQLLQGKFPVAPYDWLNERQKKKFKKLNGYFEQCQFIDETIQNLILRDKLLDYTTLPSYITNQVKKVIKTATNRDINKRYDSCSEFLKDLYNLTKNKNNWWTENNNLYSNNGKKFFRIKFEKNKYILENSKNDIIWTKNNKHNGDLESIINLVNKNH
ncbi:protein kinase domain-containing protein [Pseudomonas shirazensis]